MMKKSHDDEVEYQTEEMDLNNPAYMCKPNEYHDWRQQGPYLVCKSCEIQHAVFVGMGRVLTGIDDKGRPILTKR